jgi:hypothetical protein
MHPGYAQSLAEFGIPRELTRCGGWILERPVPGFPYHDAMGCYPLFVCRDWSQLHLDLDNLGDQLVSLALVTDPFGEYDERYLKQYFDVVIPFKNHFIINCSQQINVIVSKNHRYRARKALKNIRVEKCEEPIRFLEEWITLYGTLIQRHNLKGVSAFSRKTFVTQLKVPGIVMFAAMHNDTPVGIILWYVQGEVGYYHLGAYSNIGYKLGASFALFWFAIEYFANNGLQRLNLGAGAGIKDSNTDGLSRFKRGWSTGTRTAYFCGRIFNHAQYSELVKIKGISATDYFPAYRKGEFG